MNPANDNAVPAVIWRPLGFMPRGLSRKEAAYYIGVSPSLFDEMVHDGRAPAPRTINSRTVWDAREIDEAFDNLPRRETGSASNPWDAVA